MIVMTWLDRLSGGLLQKKFPRGLLFIYKRKLVIGCDDLGDLLYTSIVETGGLDILINIE